MKASGICSQIPIVRSPWTLLCPRTGQTPAPFFPICPRSKWILTISSILATAFLCCVSPIAQHVIIREDFFTASAVSSSNSRESPLSPRILIPRRLLEVLFERGKAITVSIDELAIDAGAGGFFSDSRRSF